MFFEFYGLTEQPFGVTPDPKFLFWSHSHREALSSLFYGIESSRGFVTLIAPPGMGKTTLIFHLLERLRPTSKTVFLFQTQCSSREFLRYLLADLGCDAGEQDPVALHGKLNEILVECAREGKRFVLVIDEAQNLDDSVIETVRLLSDFETPGRKLMQIVLSGQPQLAVKLERPELSQLRQRISILGRLDPLGEAEVGEFIEHRLAVAGYHGPGLFAPGAVALIAAHSGGIPRAINNLCFNALSLGFARRARKIDASIVKEVVSDLELRKPAGAIPAIVRAPNRRPLILAASMALVLIAVAVTWFSLGKGGPAAQERIVQAPPAPGPVVKTDAAGATSSSKEKPDPLNGPAALTNPERTVDPELPGRQVPPDGGEADGYWTVTVEPDATLFSINMKYLGRRWSAQLRDEILALNPTITDPNLILSGTRLRLPLKPENSASAAPAAPLR